MPSYSYIWYSSPTLEIPDHNRDELARSLDHLSNDIDAKYHD